MKLMDRINAINEVIALRVTLTISTMWCVYVFALMVSIPLFFPMTTPVIMFLSSSFLQLIFLPLILVGQNLLSRASEQRAAQDHDMIVAELEILKNLMNEATAERIVLVEVAELLRRTHSG